MRRHHAFALALMFEGAPPHLERVVEGGLLPAVRQVHIGVARVHQIVLHSRAPPHNRVVFRGVLVVFGRCLVGGI